MQSATPYPLDYQRSLAQTLRMRISHPSELEQALARLRRADYGVCTGCGEIIPFLQVAQDPTRQTCLSCQGDPHVQAHPDSH